MRSRSYRRPLLIASIITAIMAILLVAGSDLLQKNLERKRVLNAPPDVQIHTPSAGESIPAGSDLSVRATAMGGTTIQRMELWIDGETVAQASNSSGSQGSFHGQFSITLEEGGHMISVRAVDQSGLVGQSLPFPIYAIAPEAAGETQPIYAAQPGETLQDIAEKVGVEADRLRDLNPGSGNGELPQGAEMKVPYSVPDGSTEEEGTEKPPTEGEAAQEGTPPESAPSEGPPVSVLQPAPIQIPDTRPLEVVAIRPIFREVIGAIMRLEPPPMPTALEAMAADCKLTLKWNDNAENEDHYKIWMAGLGLPARVIATVSSSPHSGPVWFQFDTPPAGIYSFWVEAVNVITSQPSEIVWIGVPATQCEHYTAAYLQVEVTGMTFEGGYNQVYCYLSAEGTPERRFPADDSDFFHLTDGQLSFIFAGLSSFTLPFPEDQVLDLEGECWGWLGKNLDPLGTFAKQVISSQWDGSARVIETTNFNIIFTVEPFGAMEAQGTYTFYDPTIAPPTNVHEVDTGVRYNPFHPTHRILQWDWDGDESAISGFTVYLNGEPFKAALPHERSVYYGPPAICGAHFKFEVTANAIQGESIRSQAFEYDQEPCQVYAEVHFVSIETGWTDDCFGLSCGYHCSGAEKCKKAPCYVLQAYYDIWATGAVPVRENYFSPQMPLHMQCDTVYMFNQMGELDKLIVPIDPLDPTLRFGARFKDDDNWPADFSDIVVIGEEISMAIEDWPGYQEEFIYDKSNDTAWTITTIRVRGFEAMGQ